MATGTLSPSPWFTGLDSNGAPVSGGKLYTYIAGTTTNLATYSDVGLTTPNANPIVLDSAGRAVIYLTAASYRFDLKTSADVLIKSQDNISATPTTELDTDIPGVAGEALTAGQVVYLSDGSGGKTVGKWYLADADFTYASSTAVFVGMVPSNISNGATGSIRLVGRVTTAAPVTTGLTYYVSATAGALTTTPPSNARLVGMADSGTTLVLAPNPAPTPAVTIPNADNGVNDFRLSLTTGVPVTTTDVTAATTLYCVPYKGNRIALYDAAGVATLYTSAQFSIAVPATTSQAYDIFAYNNAGVATLELLAWTNDTTRATAIVLTTTGVYTKSGDLTRRYLGSFRTTAVSGQTEDSLTTRYLWNYYHRVRRPLQRLETTTSWTYASTTIRQANGAAANQVNFIIGVSEDPVDAQVGVSSTFATGSQDPIVGLGLDSTTTFASNQILTTVFGVSGAGSMQRAQYIGHPGIGKHSLMWNEAVTATTTTFYSNTAVIGGSTSASAFQSGILGLLYG